MDNQNEKWLDDILGQSQDTEKFTADEQTVASADLVHPDELELERIVQETIAENWGSELTQESVADDPDATQFFAPHITSTGSLLKNTVTDIPVQESVAKDLKESAPEPSVTEDVPVDEDALLRDIFAAVSHDSALLVGDTVIEETPAAGIGITEPTGQAGLSISPAQESIDITPPAADVVPPQKPELTPHLSADAIIREVLAEDPRTKSNMSEDAIIDSVLAETQAKAAAAEATAKAPEKKSNWIISNKSQTKKPTKKAAGDDNSSIKVRPAPKQGYGLFGIPHILSTGIWVALILFIGITLGRTVWLCAEDLLALGKTGQAVSITVAPGDSLSDVAAKLEESGMIRYRSLFETFAKLTGKGDNIQVGTIDFDEKIVYDYNALLSAMSYRDGPTDTIEIMIPEGYNCQQIFALLEEKGVCSVEDLENYAANGELSDYWFLEGVERGTRYCLEGFLFPDTYEFYLDADPKSALEKMLDGFDSRFSDALKEKFEKLKEDTNLDLTFYEMVIMASMVQKEKAADLEGYKIASVFYNRLRKPAEYPMLNCDSTIIYAQNVYEGSPTIIDRYDTYKITGLPPTPICNPGLSSIDAALEPENTDYYYFVLDKENKEHVFAKTYSEHQRNLQRLGYYD